MKNEKLTTRQRLAISLMLKWGQGPGSLDAQEARNAYYTADKLLTELEELEAQRTFEPESFEKERNRNLNQALEDRIRRKETSRMELERIFDDAVPEL